MSIVGISIKEVAICSVCGVRYDDKESMDIVKKGIDTGYAPCPNITCKGELSITLDIKEV